MYPACIVPANFWINYLAVFQPKVESVWVVVVIGSGFPGDAFASVFDDAPAFGNELCGVNAPAVNIGPPNLDPNGSLPSPVILRHMLSPRHFLVVNSLM